MRRRALLATAAAALVFPASAAAHVQITQVAEGEGALLTVTSPNENQSQDLTGLRVTVPDGLTVAEIADAPGFTAQIVRDQSGKAVALSWQGGKVAPQHLAEKYHAQQHADRNPQIGLRRGADRSQCLDQPEIDHECQRGGEYREPLAVPFGIRITRLYGEREAQDDRLRRIELPDSVLREDVHHARRESAVRHD